MARLSIYLIGPFMVSVGGKPITAFESDKVRALLAYLAVEAGQPHRREFLAGLLWPELPDKAARANLRNALSKLRKTLKEPANTAPYLLATRQTITLSSDSHVWVDVQAFRALAGDAAVPNTGLAQLEAAAELHRGSFLQGFSIEDSIVFEEWALLQREDLDQQALSVFDQLANAYRSRGDLSRAIPYLRRQIVLEPWDETIHRTLMTALAANNQRSDAVQQYQACVQALHIELGVFPTRETTALYEHILNGSFAPGTTPTTFIRGYEVRETLSENKRGQVFRAYHPVIGRDVAIKVIRPEYANQPNFIRRFEVEAQVVARLEHPHIVPLYDYWRDPSGAYLVMRWLRGGTLGESLRHGPWRPNEAVRLAEQIAAALAFAHLEGVIHQDVKPANILLNETQNGFLTNFSIASILSAAGVSGTKANAQVQFQGEEASSYTAPELIAGQPSCPQTDIYGLGIVLYMLLTGAHPFPDQDPQSPFGRHQRPPVPSVRRHQPGLPAAVDAVLQKATALDPQERFTNTAALVQAFRSSLFAKAGPRPAAPRIWVPIRNPYKGLAPFAEADAPDFFGREDLIAKLLDRVGQDGPHFLTVLGPSGSGKSSVVKAGLIPALRRGALPGSQDWYIVTLTPGPQPLQSLETALLQVAIHPPTAMMRHIDEDPAALVAAIRSSLPDQNATVVLVIDQFEEVYTLSTDGQTRQQFTAALGALASHPDSPVRVVATLRADFYDQPLNDPNLGALVQAANEVVLPQTPSDIAEAILKPAARVGVEVEPTLAAALIADVSEQPGALPLLQFALTELFSEHSNQILTLAAYQTSGGIKGSLGRRAEAIYQELKPPEQSAAQQVFMRLITLGEGVKDTRRRVLQTELEALAEPIPEKPGQTTVIQTILKVFGQHRLLTFDRNPTTRSPTVEIAHEALLSAWPRLRSWLETNRSDIRLQRTLNQSTTEWLAAGRDPSYLLRGNRLNLFKAWQDETTLVLTRSERRFLAASLSARRKRNAAEAVRQARENFLILRSRQNLRALVAVFAVAAAIALLLSLYAFNQRTIAQQHAATATVAQGETLFEKATALAAQAIAQEEANRAAAEASARGTQQVLAEMEAMARATLQAIAEGESAVAEAAEENALYQASIGLASQALDQLDNYNSELSVLLAFAALEEYPYTPQAEAALARAVQESLPYKQMLDPGGLGINGNWVDFSPDGRRIALATNPNLDGDHSAVIFDYETGKVDQVLRLKLPAGNVETTGCQAIQIRWSPDGKTVALVSNSYSPPAASANCHHLGTYSTETGIRLKKFYVEGAASVDWSPDGKELLVGSEQGDIQVLDARTGDVRLTMAGHNATGFELLTGTDQMVSIVRYSPDGTRAASFTFGGSLYIWDIQTGTLQAVFNHPPEFILEHFTYGGHYHVGLAWSPDGTQIATGWFDGLVRIWDLATGEIQLRFAGHTLNVIGVDWASDGSYILSQGRDGTTRLWLAETGQEVLTLPSSGIGNTAISADARRIAVPTQYGLMTWDISTLPPVFNHATPPEISIFNSLWTPDGKYYVVANRGLVFDWEEPGTHWEIPPVFGYSAIAPDGRRLLAATINERTAQVIDIFTGEQISIRQTEPTDELANEIFHAWSPDGTRAASANFGDSRVTIWDPQTGAVLGRSPVGECSLMTPEFSPNGRFIASGCLFARNGGSPVYLLDSETGKLLYELSNTDGASTLARWSPDGKKLLVYYQNGRIKIWDTNLWQVLKEIDLHTNSGQWSLGLTWSPDGRRAASGDPNGTIYVWDTTTGDIYYRTHPLGELQWLAWSPDGQFLGIQFTNKMPIFRRVWQSTEALIDYTTECCIWRDLTPNEREQFGLPPSDTE